MDNDILHSHCVAEYDYQGESHKLQELDMSQSWRRVSLESLSQVSLGVLASLMKVSRKSLMIAVVCFTVF